MDGLELLLVELALVVLLAILSMSEAALHAIRRPQVVEERGLQAPWSTWRGSWR